MLNVEAGGHCNGDAWHAPKPSLAEAPLSQGFRDNLHFAREGRLRTHVERRGEGGDRPAALRPHDGAGGDEAAEALLVGERVARPDAAPAKRTARTVSTGRVSQTQTSAGIDFKVAETPAMSVLYKQRQRRRHSTFSRRYWHVRNFGRQCQQERYE